ncbi:MAG: hypothetical protein QOI28_2043 [Mycobacterium sp.]|jgi:hypothetical protein|nr:hypothetical protein [Mycobacterium sp.]MDT5189792.1 hypothetical protein [Mycobacterium sp.]MDT5288278.1 hypothetical protein [Mycobacterium sp.]MDT5358897.1 hypothetical protein [Mycobacterium sp.]
MTRMRNAELFEDLPQSFAQLDSEYLKLRPRRLLGEVTTMMLIDLSEDRCADLLGSVFVTGDERRDPTRVGFPIDESRFGPRQNSRI